MESNMTLCKEMLTILLDFCYVRSPIEQQQNWIKHFLKASKYLNCQECGLNSERMGIQRGKAKNQSPFYPGDICLYRRYLRENKSQFRESDKLHSNTELGP